MTRGPTYFIRFRGRISGPYDLDSLRKLVSRRQLTRAHSLSSDGIEWRSPTEFEEIFGTTERGPMKERLEELFRRREAARAPVPAEPEHDSGLDAGSSRIPAMVSTSPARSDFEEPARIHGLIGRDASGGFLSTVAVVSAGAVLLSVLLPFGRTADGLQSVFMIASSGEVATAIVLAVVLGVAAAAIGLGFGGSMLMRGVVWLVGGAVAGLAVSSSLGLPFIGPVFFSLIWLWPGLVAGVVLWRWCDPTSTPARVVLIASGSLLSILAASIATLMFGTDYLDDAMWQGDFSGSLDPLLLTVGSVLVLVSPALMGIYAIVLGATGRRRGPFRSAVFACGSSAVALACFGVISESYGLVMELRAGNGSGGGLLGDMPGVGVIAAVFWYARFFGVLLASTVLIAIGIVQLAIARFERRVLELPPGTRDLIPTMP